MPLALLLAASVALAAPVPKVKNNRPDAELFVGTWEAVTPKQEGQQWGKAIWTIDDKLQLRIEYPEEVGRATTWAVKLAPEQSPKEIDVGGLKGVYEIDGEGIRVAYSSGDRPTGFDLTGGVSVHVLRRIEPTGGK